MCYRFVTMSDINPFDPLSCASCAFERTTRIIEAGVVSTPGYPPEKARAILGICATRRRAVRANLATAGGECEGNLLDKDGEQICRDLGALTRALGPIDALSPAELTAIYEAHRDGYSQLGLDNSDQVPTQPGNYL
jgi:hypothetical protein